MLTRRIRAALFVAAVAGAGILPAMPASAGPCDDQALRFDKGGVIYLDVREVGGSQWIYAETNNVAGLQREGESQIAFDLTGQQATATEAGETDTCDEGAPGGEGDAVLL